MTPLVQITSAHKKFPTPAEEVVALDDVSLVINNGEFVCIYGASGSGKTTLLNVIAGLTSTDAGTVTIASTSMDQANSNDRAALRLKTMGVIFQDDNLLAELTASENIELPLQALGFTPSQARMMALEALQRVSLEHLANRVPPEMSGGQRQRVGIARALTGERSLILADEPTGALDSTTSRELFGLLRDLSKQGSTVVVATHDPLARDFASRILTMRDGILTEDEPAR